MTEPVDLDELARRYLDLWQDQMTALAGDQEFAEALQQLMTTMGATTAAPSGVTPEFQRAWLGMMTGQQTEASADDGNRGRAPGAAPGAAPRAETAAAAPDDGGADLDRLAGRLAALEERIAALEAGAKRSRGGAAGKPRKPRS